MADYGGVGGGRSLRDALNAIMPMTGMGEYGAMFPPQTGGDQPGSPVPIPQPRPPMPPQVGLPSRPPVPGYPPPQTGLPPRPVVPGYPPPDEGLLSRPPLPQGGLQQPSYAQRLGLTGGY